MPTFGRQNSIHFNIFLYFFVYRGNLLVSNALAFIVTRSFQNQLIINDLT